MKTILTAGILSLAFFSITMAKEKNGLIDSYKSAHSKNNKTLPFNYRYSQPIQMEVGKTYPLLVFFPEELRHLKNNLFEPKENLIFLRAKYQKESGGLM
jgi:hypothetical protein